MRIFFLGTPEFAGPTLEYLAHSQHTVVGVGTRPDQPKGRGNKTTPALIKQTALKLGLPLITPVNINEPESIRQVKAFNPQIIVVVAFGQMLKKSLLDLPEYGCINVHASLLPKYRGAAPIQWALAHGENETGITVQRMVEKMDAGNILIQRHVVIAEEDTSQTLSGRLADLGGPAVDAALDLLQDPFTALGQVQDEKQVSFAPRLTKEHGKIDWSLPGEMIHHRVRAFFPWPGTYTTLGDQVIKILQTRKSAFRLPGPTTPGSILLMSDEGDWVVAAGEGTTVTVCSIQLSNGKIMTPQAFARGHSLKPGQILYQ
jgi:methionyl-tRNA formyltransferase